MSEKEINNVYKLSDEQLRELVVRLEDSKENWRKAALENNNDLNKTRKALETAQLLQNGLKEYHEQQCEEYCFELEDAVKQIEGLAKENTKLIQLNETSLDYNKHNHNKIYKSHSLQFSRTN